MSTLQVRQSKKSTLDQQVTVSFRPLTLSDLAHRDTTVVDPLLLPSLQVKCVVDQLLLCLCGPWSDKHDWATDLGFQDSSISDVPLCHFVISVLLFFYLQ